MNAIVRAILDNEKKVAKIKAYNGNKYDKAKALVVGECAVRRIKLSNEEVLRCVSLIIRELTNKEAR